MIGGETDSVLDGIKYIDSWEVNCFFFITSLEWFGHSHLAVVHHFIWRTLSYIFWGKTQHWQDFCVVMLENVLHCCSFKLSTVWCYSWAQPQNKYLSYVRWRNQQKKNPCSQIITAQDPPRHQNLWKCPDMHRRLFEEVQVAPELINTRVHSSSSARRDQRHYDRT